MRHEIRSSTSGIVWKVEVVQEQSVDKDQELIILEVMKMEIPITSPAQGVVTEILISEGASVLEGDVLAIIEGSL